MIINTKKLACFLLPILCFCVVLPEAGARERVRSLGSITKPVSNARRSVESLEVKSRVFTEDADVSDYIFLPAPNREELSRANEESLEKSLESLGVVRRLEASGSVKKPQRWSVMEDGTRVWAVIVHSESAKGLRLHLVNSQIPDGAELIITSLSDPSDTMGPYTRKDIEADSFWTESVFDEAVVLEFHLPAGVSTKNAGVSVEAVAHLYAFPTNGLWPYADSCHNDVRCADPVLQHLGNGVAGYTFIIDETIFWCTGSLLNNTRQDFQDFFLTSTHCVNFWPFSRTMEMYWFYQSPSCGQEGLDISQAVRTGGGAKVLEPSYFEYRNDYSLLMLQEPSPEGATYLGWTVDRPAHGSQVVGIHHPAGSYKRINYGTIVDPYTNNWVVEWSSGITQNGSSGSPLIDSRGRVIGHLWGGASSCANPLGHDEYGKFSNMYRKLQDWLDPAAEPLNNDFNDMTPLTGTAGIRRSSNLGADKESGESRHAGNAGGKSIWWKWKAPRSAPVTFDTLESDFDTLLAVYSGSIVNNLSVIMANDDFAPFFQSSVTIDAIKGREYRIAVDGYGGAVGDVVLKWRQEIPDNEQVIKGPPSDYSGSGASDCSVFNPFNGAWYILLATGEILAWNNQWGWNSALPLLGDYNGDGRHDLCVFDTATGYWYVKGMDGELLAWKSQWGWSSTTPIPGDFDGDGKWDQAVYHEFEGMWYVRRMNGPMILWAENWGFNGAKPVPGDYNGNGKSDLGVFYPYSGDWFVRSLDGQMITSGDNNWGWPGASVVPGDYDGDGIYDQAIYDNATGLWYIQRVDRNPISWRSQWGWPGAKAVSGDYDGDGIYDLAVVDTATGHWYIRGMDGTVIASGVNWGWSGASFPAWGN